MLGLVKRVAFPAVAAVALCASAPLASATILAPGGVGPPDPLVVGSSTLLASGTDAYIATDTPNPGQISGTIAYGVVSDPLNVFGAGDLDFLYQVQQNSAATDSIETIAATSFAGFSVDAGIAAPGSVITGLNGFGPGTVVPTTVQRNSAPGNVVQFNFTTPFGASTTSVLLVIETNAKTFGTGGVSAHDGAGTPSLPALEPTIAPLPATASTGLALLGGLGLLTGVNVLRRRRQMA